MFLVLRSTHDRTSDCPVELDIEARIVLMLTRAILRLSSHILVNYIAMIGFFELIL